MGSSKNETSGTVAVVDCGESVKAVAGANWECKGKLKGVGWGRSERAESFTDFDHGCNSEVGVDCGHNGISDAGCRCVGSGWAPDGKAEVVSGACGVLLFITEAIIAS